MAGLQLAFLDETWLDMAEMESSSMYGYAESHDHMKEFGQIIIEGVHQIIVNTHEFKRLDTGNAGKWNLAQKLRREGK